MKNRHKIISIFILIISIVLIFTKNTEKENNQNINTKTEYSRIEYSKTENNNYFIEKVIDGDTIIVNVFNDNKKIKEETIRILGINAPESKGPYRKEECFGENAKSILNQELKKGERVYLENDEKDLDKDKYNRLLRYVYDEENNLKRDIGLFMIENGYAYHYKKSKVKNKNFDIYNREEENAKKENKGIWKECF